MTAAATMVALAALAGAPGAPAPAGPSAPELYAVVVGHNGGAAGLPPLRFADDDAIRFSFVLSGLARAPERADVTLLTNTDEQTRADLERAGLRPRPSAPPTRTAVLAAIDSIRQKLAARPADSPPPLFFFI